MRHSDVRTEKQALSYLTDCHLATVSSMAMLKSRKRYEYTRHIEIAQKSINFLIEFNIEIEENSRAHDVIYEYNKSVSEWAKKFE